MTMNRKTPAAEFDFQQFQVKILSDISELIDPILIPFQQRLEFSFSFCSV
jgi:hypothetical protein